MFSKVHDRLGTAGLVVAIVALVAALTGTAFAAAGLTGQQKKEVKSIAKRYAGKRGPQGAPGPKGDTGATGAPGKDGSNGAQGTAGVSPTGTAFTGSKTVGSTSCTEGGIEYTGATTNLVCNGKKGSPWTAGGTLPANATETGAWTLPHVGTDAVPAGLGTVNVPISFSIPLAAELDREHVHVIAENGEEVFYDFNTSEPKEVTSTACLGTVAEPKATSGNLCIYVGTLTEEASPGASFSTFKYVGPVKKAAEITEDGASVSGAALRLHVQAESEGSGTWAVTG